MKLGSHKASTLIFEKSAIFEKTSNLVRRTQKVLKMDKKCFLGFGKNVVHPYIYIFYLNIEVLLVFMSGKNLVLELWSKSF